MFVRPSPLLQSQRVVNPASVLACIPLPIHKHFPSSYNYSDSNFSLF